MKSMKKLTLVFALLLALTATRSSLAQSFNGGLIAGATFSQVDGDRYAGYHHLGWTAGAFVNLPLDDHLSCQMELKYLLLGAHSDVKEEVEYNYNHFYLHFHYAELPLMLRYDLGGFNIGGKSMEFIVLELGASFDFLLKSQESADFEPEYENTHWNFFSMTGNAGVQFNLTQRLGLGVRFMYSIVPIRFTGNPGWFYNQYYNKAWQATLTYSIMAPGK